MQFGIMFDTHIDKWELITYAGQTRAIQFMHRDRHFINLDQPIPQDEFVLPIITVLSNELTYKAEHREGSPV